jgi:hypothetical protein
MTDLYLDWSKRFYMNIFSEKPRIVIRSKIIFSIDIIVLISMPISGTISKSATRNAYDIDSLNLLAVSVLQVY